MADISKTRGRLKRPSKPSVYHLPLGFAGQGAFKAPLEFSGIVTGMGVNLRAVAIGGLLSFVLSACTTAPMAPEPSTGWGDRPSYVRAQSWTECVPYARQISGIEIYGDAHTWWDQADGRYARAPMPQSGSMMVLFGYAGPKRAHLAWVTRVVSAREIRVDHANWLNDGNLYLNSPVIDVSPNNDWSMVRVYNNRDDHLGINNYDVRGFISSTRVAARN